MGISHVLVIEDDHLVGWALHRALSALPVAVEVVATGQEAIARLESSHFDLAFLDIHLPDANGLELLGRIKTVSPDTRVLVITSDATLANRQRAVAEGAWQFIEKPFALDDITRVVAGLRGSFRERRRHDRFLARLNLSLHLLDPAPEDADMELRYLEATAVDVGAGGLRLRTPYPLRPGQRVAFKATSGEEPLARLLRSGEPALVVWAAEGKEGFAAGLAYEVTPGRIS